MTSLRSTCLFFASATGLCALGLFAWGCVSTELDVARSPSDAAGTARSDPPRIDVLGAGFDSDTLALPGPDPRGGGHEGHGQPSAMEAPTGHEGHTMPSDPAGGATPTTYACAHHPDVTSPTPGNCPKCGMELVKKPPVPLAPSAATATPQPSGAPPAKPAPAKPAPAKPAPAKPAPAKPEAPKPAPNPHGGH